MDNLTFYIIFHKNIFPENTPDYPCFKYMAANELIVKEIDHSKIKHDIVCEYDFSGYNPMYQMLNFCDNSILLSVPPPPSQFTGFCQYDMVINSDKFKKIFDSLHISNLVIGFFYYKQERICDVISSNQWDEILKLYNNKYSTDHTMNSLKDCPYFLLNTFILPTWFYIKLQDILRSYLPAVFKILGYNMRHIAGTLERLTSLMIACAIKERVVCCVLSDAITEDRTQTIIDPIRHNTLKPN